jgi:transcriptional regulator with XRE-family HTH domain
MKTSGERIKFIIQKLKLNEFLLAEMIGINRSQINRISNNKSELTKPVALAIELKAKISSTWLLTGEGEMFLSPNQSGKDDLELTHDEREIIRLVRESPVHLTLLKWLYTKKDKGVAFIKSLLDTN